MAIARHTFRFVYFVGLALPIFAFLVGLIGFAKFDRFSAPHDTFWIVSHAGGLEVSRINKPICGGWAERRDPNAPYPIRKEGWNGFFLASLPTWDDLRYHGATASWWFRGDGDFSIRIPYWPAVLATLILLGLQFYAMGRKKCGSNPGLCVFCGYDLRATPERCPECGLLTRVPAIGSIAVGANQRVAE